LESGTETTGFAGGAKPEQRLAAAAADARAAEARADGAAASEAWRLYRLIRDAQRDPDELLAEGIALSAMAIELSEEARRALEEAQGGLPDPPAPPT